MSGARSAPFFLPKVLRRIAFAAFVTAQACSASDRPADQPVSRPAAWLKVPTNDTVIFNGVIDYDRAGVSMPQMLYPAPNIAGMFAAVLAHGLFIGSAKNAQKQKLQEEADLVLAPYLPMLNAYKYPELMQTSLAHIDPPYNVKLLQMSSTPAVAAVIIESAPVFSITQDQRALILDLAVAIGNTGAAEKYQAVLRVLSFPSDAEKMTEFWNDDEGRRLKREAARLLATALTATLDDRTKPTADNPLQTTVRYLEGGTEKTERGQVLREQCGRALIRTLRGNLMSVPVKRAGPGNDTASCVDALIGN